MTFKELIKKHGYNLCSLAKKMGVDKATTHYWVSHKAIPREENLEKVIKILGESRETIVKAILNN